MASGPALLCPVVATEPVDVRALADLRTPYAIHVAATLRVADALADGPLPALDLAERVGADADRLTRLMLFLVYRGVFAEPEPGVFAGTDASAPLRRDHPRRLREWLDLDGAVGRADLAFGHLLDAVRDGSDAYERTYGRGFWDDLGADPGLSESFDALMTMKSRWSGPAIVAGYDWSGVSHVVDVGGGAGLVLAQILRAAPQARGTLLDLAGPASAAERLLADSDAADRADVVQGSFFDPLPTGADVYLLCDVLSDWVDEDAIRILRRCAEAAAPDGRVLIAGMVPVEAAGGSFTDMDLRMMVYLGGRMRDAARTAVVADEAGLEVCDVLPTTIGYALIECRPAA